MVEKRIVLKFENLKNWNRKKAQKILSFPFLERRKSIILMSDEEFNRKYCI